jgi:PDZ domain-containing protein
VAWRQLTSLEALVAWLDPHLDVVSRSQLFAPGETEQQEKERAISQMDQSKLDATYVVLTELTDYPKDHRAGALVEGTATGCAADGELFPGDLIFAIDEQPVRGLAAASRLIGAAPSGTSLTFDLRVDGKPESVDLVREPCGDSKEPLVGVSLINNFPFGVVIESGDVGGPSAGLMWALGLYDLLTPGDLTDGRMIAGTGEIGLDGTVYPIGGIGEKIVAAEDAGASLFLVPEGNLQEAREAGGDDMRLVPVSTFEEALGFLEEGRSST